MAKTATTKETVDEVLPKAEESLPAVVGGSMPAHLMEDVADYSSAGMSDRQQDFLLPFLYVAQANSPQLKRQQEDKYIPGLEAGDIFNTATGQFWKGSEGVVVHAAFFQAAEVEWATRKSGGGYIATHSPESPIVKTVRIDPADQRVRLVAPGADGKPHQLVETRYHFVILPTGSPAVIGFASTGLQVSRQWMTMMREHKAMIDGQPRVMPAWSRKYVLKTVYRTNDQGDWFQMVVHDGGWSGPEDILLRESAKEFFRQARERGGVVLGRPPEADDGADSTRESMRDASYRAGTDGGEEPPI